MIKWARNIGDIIIDYRDNGKIKRDLTIIDRKIENKIQYFKYKCNVCGWNEGWMSKNNLRYNSCACCSGKRAVRGINTLGDIYPDLIQYFKNTDDAFLCTIRSDKKFLMKCPQCGHEHYMIMKNLTRRHYSCPACGDGFSYPEKFVMEFLNQLNVKYIHQLNKKYFIWCGKYRYDFYLNDYNMIIETHGRQHYDTPFGYDNSKTIDQEQTNDLVKKQLAKNNNITQYIVLDCRYSNKEWMKNVLNNSFDKIFDLSNIDWEKCASLATKSNIIPVCEYFELHKNKNITTTDIAKYFNITRDNVVRYLHKGTDMGICNYDGGEARRQASKKGIASRKHKKVSVYDANNNYIKTFTSAKELEKQSLEEFGVQFSYAGIVYTCTGEQKTHQNYKFKYVEE